MNRTSEKFIMTGASILLLCAGLLSAQDTTKKAAASGGGSVSRGKTVFQQKCALCHYDTSDQKKIGPGLKGSEQAWHVQRQWDEDHRRKSEELD